MLKSRDLSQFIFTALGLIFIIGLFSYSYNIGQDKLLNYLWILAIIIPSFFLIKTYRIPKTNLKKYFKDFLIICLILLIFIPIYTFNIYDIPYQVNSDEIVFLGLVNFYDHGYWPANLLGISGYHELPTFIYLIYDYLGKSFGEINLYSMRLTHAGFGLISIILMYLFFRIFQKPYYSFLGAIILGSSHSFITISRMALRLNSAVFILIIAMIFFLIGHLHKKKIFIYFSGVFSGLGFYTYFNARVTIVYLVIFVLFIYLNKKDIKYAKNISILIAVGFLLSSTPIIAASLLLDKTDSFDYSKNQLLIFSEGRETQMTWTESPSIKSAYLLNIKNGMSYFFNKVEDSGRIYSNAGFGFLDPITGILAFAGFILILFSSKKTFLDKSILVSFIIQIILFTFIVNKNPHFGRMLITLPFVSYFIIKLLSSIQSMIIRNKINLLFKILTGVLVLFILIFNIHIFGNFVINDDALNDDIGGTIRYVESIKGPRLFSIVFDDEFPYFNWDGNWLYHMVRLDNNRIPPPEIKINLTNLNSWVFHPQKSLPLEGWPKNLTKSLTFACNNYYLQDICEYSPVTLFLNKDLFDSKKDYLYKLDPKLKVYEIIESGDLLAIEMSLFE